MKIHVLTTQVKLTVYLQNCVQALALYSSYRKYCTFEMLIFINFSLTFPFEIFPFPPSFLWPFLPYLVSLYFKELYCKPLLCAFLGSLIHLNKGGGGVWAHFNKYLFRKYFGNRYLKRLMQKGHRHWES